MTNVPLFSCQRGHCPVIYLFIYFCNSRTSHSRSSDWLVACGPSWLPTDKHGYSHLFSGSLTQCRLLLRSGTGPRLSYRLAQHTWVSEGLLWIRLQLPVVSVSRCGLAVRRLAGKQKDLGSIRFGSPFFSLQHGGLWTLSCYFAHTINETLKWLTQLPTLMQNHSGGDSVTSRC